MSPRRKLPIVVQSFKPLREEASVSGLAIEKLEEEKAVRPHPVFTLISTEMIS